MTFRRVHNASCPGVSLFGKGKWQKLILVGAIMPAGLAFVPASQAVDLPATFTINADSGTNPYYREGLLEGFVNAADDETTANPGNSSPELTLRMGNNTAFGDDAWANSRTWIYTGQMFTGPSGVISYAFNNDDTDWLKINGAVVLNDNAWDTAAAGVVTGLTPNTWVDFEYRVGDNGAGGAGPSGQNPNGASNWNNTTGAVLSWNNEGGSLNANDYIGGDKDLGKPMEIAGSGAGQSLFRYQAGSLLQDDLNVIANSTITVNGSKPEVAEKTLNMKTASATLTVNDGPADSDPLTPIHKTLSIADGTTFTANNQALTISGTSDVRPGRISAGSFTGNTLTSANPGAPGGKLIIDHVDAANPSNLAGVKLQSGENGNLVIVGVQGNNPIASMTQPLTISGPNGRINLGSRDQDTTFNNSFAANDSGTLEHSTPTNDTLGSATNGVSIAAGKNLTVEVTGGSLTVAGAVTGQFGTLTKAGVNTLTLNGATDVGNVTLSGGQLIAGGSFKAGNATINDGSFRTNGQANIGTLQMFGGTARFAGATTITGASSITNASVVLSSQTGNNITGSLNVGSGGSLQVLPGSLGNGAVTLSGGVLDLTGGNGVTALTGFGTTGTGYQINFNNTAGANAPSVNNDVLKITEPVNGYAGSAYNTTKQDVTKFISNFTYQEFGDNTGNLTNTADGAAFVIQNSGTTALGGAGGGFGYSGVGSSAGFLLNIWGGGRGGIGQQFSTGGKTPGNNADFPQFNGTGAVDLRGGHPINVTLTYNGTNVDVTLVDTVTNARFNTTYTGVDIPAAIGGNTAYVGFSGANGGLNSDQRFSNFVYKTATASENFGGNISVAGGATSTINSGAVTVKSNLGSLTLASTANLQVTGASNVAFTGTTFSTPNGTYTLGTEKNEVSLGPVTLGAGTGGPSVTKTGNGILVVENSLPSGTSLNIQGGKVSVLAQGGGSTNPLANTTLTMNGGGIDLSSKGGDLTIASIPYALAGTTGGISAGFASGAVTTPVSVTVNSPINIAADKTMNLSAAKQHTLVLNGGAPATAAGTANIDGGNVTANGDALKGLKVTLFPSSGSTTLNVPAGTTIASLAGNSKGTLAIGSGAGTKTLVVDQSTDTTFGGAIQNGPGGALGALTKSGTGTLSLTGTSSFTGGLTVTQGVVDLESSLSAGGGALNLAGGTIRVAPSGLNVLHYDTDAGAQAAFSMVAADFASPQALADVYSRFNNFFAGMTPTNGTGTRSTVGGQADLNFQGGTGAPFGIFGITDEDNMTVRMSGYINIAEAGTIRFLSESDDGSVVFIDGVPVVNNNNYQGPTTRGSDTPGTDPTPVLPQPATPTLSAGQHKIDVGFYEGGGGAAVKVLYRPVGATSDIVITNDVLGGFYSTNPVNVTANSTLDLQGSTSRFGTLTLNGGKTLTVTGGNVTFTGGALQNAAGGGFTIDKAAGTMSIGAINDANAAVTINKIGAGTVLLTNTQTAQLQNTASVINVNAGAFGAVFDSAGTNPLGKATINLNGGALNVSSKGGNFTAGNNVNVVGTTPATINTGGVVARLGFGALAMPDGANLQVNGSGNLAFTSTAFGKSNGNYTIGVEKSALNLGTISFASGTGTSTINKTGEGVLVVESFGTNTLPAGTTFNIKGGTVGALLANGNTNPLQGTTINMDGGGVDISSKGGNLTFALPFTLQSKGAISAGFAAEAVTTPVTVTVPSALAVGTGKTFNLSAAKQHTLLLDGPAPTTAGGTVNINGGNVTANGDSLKGMNVTLLPSTGATTLNVTAGTTIASLAGDSNGTVAIGSGTGTKTLVVDQSTNTTFAGTIQNGTGAVGALTKSGTGTLSLTGTNTFTGGLTVTQGVVDLASNQAAGGGALNLSGGTIRVAPSGLNLLHYDTDAGAQAAFSMSAAELSTPEGRAAIYTRFNNFFAGMTPTNGAGTRTNVNGQVALDFNGGTGAPFGRYGIGDLDNMTVRMSGYITIPEDGSIGFLTESDDGSVLFIDGVPVVNNNNYQGPIKRGSDTPGTDPNPALPQPTTPTLTAGQHRIDIGFYEGGGGAAVKVLYRPASTGVETVITNDILGGFHGTNAVNVTGSSIIDLQGGDSSFGTLTLNNNSTLKMTGGNATFAGTALPTANGIYTIDKDAGSAVLGAITDNNAVVTINKTGAGTVVLNNTSTLQLQNTGSTININAGGVAVVLDSDPAARDPLGLAKINLNGGGLYVGSKSGDVTLTHAFTISQDSTIAAGNFGGGAVDGIGRTVNLPSLDIPAGRNLTLRSQNDYTLNVTGAITGQATSKLTVAGGNVIGSAATSVGSLQVDNGTYTAQRNVTATNGTTINGGGTLALDGTGAVNGTLTYSGGAISMNGGTVRAMGGTADLSSATFNITAPATTTTANALNGKLFLLDKGFGLSQTDPTTEAAANEILRAIPDAQVALTNQALNFGPVASEATDAVFTQFFNGAGPYSRSFTAAFVGRYTATSGGLANFQATLNDDQAAFWVDLNQNGVFEQNGSSGDERISFTQNCCGNGPVGSANLVAGQSYNILVAVRDTGGGSSLEGLVNGSDITPASQPGSFSFDSTTGGGKFQVDGGARLKLGAVTGATDVNLAGADAQFALTSTTAAVSSAKVVRTSNLLGGTATLDIAANNTFNVDNLNVSSDGILIKAGKGTVVANNQSVGLTGLLRVADGLMVLNGGVGAFTGDSGGAEVNGGTLQVNGEFRGGVSVNIGGRLSGTGKVGPVTSVNGTIAPGIAAGKLTTGNLSLSGGTLELELSNASAYDQLVVNGSVSLLSNVVLSLTLGGFDPSDDGTMNFKIIDNDGATDPVTGSLVYGNKALQPNDLFVVGNQMFKINYAGGDGNDVVLTAVPEPATAATLLGAIGTLVGMQRFRRRKA